MSHFPQFYQQMIALWEKISDKEPDQVFEILNQSIWNNKYILKQDESLFYPYLCKKGISQIKDLINVRGIHWHGNCCFYFQNETIQHQL